MGLAIVADHPRQNEVALQPEIVLRITLLDLRLPADAFLDQIERALRGADAA
ncbi:MAG: hypothetical protein ACHP7G_03975 [Actinomycetales bacterium]